MACRVIMSSLLSFPLNDDLLLVVCSRPQSAKSVKAIASTSPTDFPTGPHRRFAFALYSSILSSVRKLDGATW